MKLPGKRHVLRDGKMAALKQGATASHSFPERVLVLGTTGLVEKTARVYESARALITVDKDRSEEELRPERRLVVAQRHQDQALVYCPAGALRREELALTSEHFDTLTLTGLLPGKSVAVGDTWKVSSAVAQALCNFEGLTRQDLTGKLEAVKDEVATFSVNGTAEGIELGALVKLTVHATGQFDLKVKRLVGLEWKQQDERGQGPANPAATVDSTTSVRRKAIERPEVLPTRSWCRCPRTSSRRCR